jgi:hypothetical protein
VQHDLRILKPVCRVYIPPIEMRVIILLILWQHFTQELSHITGFELLMTVC